MYHLKGSPADPNRLYASQSSSWFGQIIQRSDDGGKTWHQPGTPPGEPTTTPDGTPKGESNKFAYDDVFRDWQAAHDASMVRRHARPWEFKRVWHLEPSLNDPDTVYAGVEDAALFRSTDGGNRGRSFRDCAAMASGSSWAPGAGGMCLHTILLDPSNPKRIFIAISSAGAFRSDDAGKTWQPINRGLHSLYIPNPTAEVGHCVHRIAMHPSRPDVLFMQKHWDVLRSDDAGESWREISGNLPTDFGFVIDVHAHEPDTIYVVPIKSDSEHFPPDGKLRVYRSRGGRQRVGGAHERACRRATATSTYCATPWPSTPSISAACTSAPPAGRCMLRPTAAISWAPIVRDLPPVRFRGGSDTVMIRVTLPAHLRKLAQVDGEVQLDVEGLVTQRSILDALEARYPMLCGTIRDHVTYKRRAFVRFFACGEDLSHEQPDAPLPEAVATGTEPFMIIGAIAGG